MQTGITTAVLKGANSPNGETRSGEDAAAYEGAEVAGGSHVVLDGQQAVISQAPGSMPTSPLGKPGRSARR